MSSLIIIGAGGLGLEVAAYAHDCGFTLKGFLDDTKPVGTPHGGVPVLGPTDKLIDAQAEYLIAVGDPASRRFLAERLAAQGAKFATLLHPASYIATGSQIGAGSVIAPFAFVGPQSRIGSHALLNIYASVAHESTLGDYVTLCPYAGTHAAANVEEEAFLGAHAVATKDVRIGARAKLAAGAIAYTDIPAGATALGNPARFRVG